MPLEIARAQIALVGATSVPEVATRVRDPVQQRGDLRESGRDYGESLVGLGLAFELGLTQGVEGLGVGAQLGAYLRHIMIVTRGQHAGGEGIGMAEGSLLAEPDDRGLENGKAGQDVV